MRTSSRSEMLKSALTLFSLRGYEAVSPNDVCELTGVQKPTLYYFFGSKEGLLDELLRELYAKLDTVVAEACVYRPDPRNYHNDVKPVLIRVAEAFFRFAVENKEFYLLLMALGFAPPQSVSAIVSGKYHKRHYDILIGMFYEISAVHPNIKEREAAYAVRFIALINAQIALWYRDFTELTAAEAENIVHGFLHGIYNR